MSALSTFAETETFKIRRNGRVLIADLKGKHQVLSTCHMNGGQRDDLTSLVNHQSCEARGSYEKNLCVMKMGREEYHQSFCENWDLEPAKTAVMNTAANMDYAAIEQETFRGVTVTAVVTGGVEGNAIRPGDPANWWEVDGKYEKVGEHPGPRVGTINTLLFFNAKLSEAALSRSVITMCEAKTAALMEYAVSSKFSKHLATGTGTDQYCIATPTTSETTFTWTGQHTRLGEIIGSVVRKATKETLRWQNGLEASMTRSIIYALNRHGLTETFLKQYLEDHSDKTTAEYLLKNWMAIIHDPQIAACAYAIASLQDRIEYNVLPLKLGQNMIVSQCALMASAFATKPRTYPDSYDALIKMEDKDLPSLVAEALLLGLKHKWND